MTNWLPILQTPDVGRESGPTTPGNGSPQNRHFRAMALIVPPHIGQVFVSPGTGAELPCFRFSPTSRAGAIGSSDIPGTVSDVPHAGHRIRCPTRSSETFKALSQEVQTSFIDVPFPSESNLK